MKDPNNSVNSFSFIITHRHTARCASAFDARLEKKTVSSFSKGKKNSFSDSIEKLGGKRGRRRLIALRYIKRDDVSEFGFFFCFASVQFLNKRWVDAMNPFVEEKLKSTRMKSSFWRWMRQKRRKRKTNNAKSEPIRLL